MAGSRKFAREDRPLVKVLELGLDWGAKPLRTISALKRFRDTLAHGKPEIVDRTFEGAVEPEV